MVAGDLMTVPAVTVDARSSAGDAARLMHRHDVKRLPVVDPEGHIVGIVSRMDLLAEFLRDDDEIRMEVVRLLVDDLEVTPDAVLVQVDDGVVHVEGRIERRSMVSAIWAGVRAVPGVVGVDERLTWELDDTIVPVSPAPWVGF